MNIEKKTILNIARQADGGVQTYEHRNQLTLITNRESIVEMGGLLRDSDETSFDMLLDITAIDWMKTEYRFDVVYFLYSNKYKEYLRLKVPVTEADPVVPTISNIWESATWYERETWDMYGIKFKGHPNLRRFYMPEDFNDPATGEPMHPLRKDFPLMGIPGSTPLPPYPEKYGELK